MKKIMMIVLIMISYDVDAKQMRKIKDVEALLAQPRHITNSVISIDQSPIIKRLDEQLQSPVASAWDDRVDDLFNLATVNPELARSYFKKMSEKMVVTDVKPIEVVVQKPEQKPEQKVIEKLAEEPKPEKIVEPTLPVGEEPMKISTKPAPPKKVSPKTENTQEIKGETGASIPSDESMKISTKPAPPKRGGPPAGGPKKSLTPAKTTTGTVAGKKEAAPTKVVEQIFSAPKLQALDNDKLVELFNGLLEKLATVPTNWNAMVVEKVEEKTKYGAKTYNVYGAPIAKWSNDITTLKKVLVSKGIMSEVQVSQIIADRIAQVRTEKKAQQVVAKQPEEKAQEELTEDDLVKLIKGLLADPKKDQIGWVVSIKGNIKALDKINHETALGFHEQFIKLTGEKPFLK